MGSDAALQPTAIGNGSAVVDPHAAVEVGVIGAPRQVDAVGETIATVRARSALTDHLRNDVRWAGGLHPESDVRIAGAATVMALHDTWVADAVIARRSADAPPGFLDNHGEDDPVVNTCLVSDFLDRIPYGAL